MSAGFSRPRCHGSRPSCRLPLQQIDAMLLHYQEPSVVDVPEGLVSLVLNQESEVRQQLAEPDIGGQLLELGELLDQLVLGRRDYGT